MSAQPNATAGWAILFPVQGLYHGQRALDPLSLPKLYPTERDARIMIAQRIANSLETPEDTDLWLSAAAQKVCVVIGAD